MNNYFCSECKTPVLIQEGTEPSKSCICEASIIAEMTAEASCVGGLTS